MDKYYIRPGQDGVLLEEDVSGTSGPLISPKMYREFCYPALCSRIQSIRSFSKQVLMHNCGNNRLLMAMFAEAGVECYQSLQTNADMDVASLQAEWGHAMAFWGGVATEILIEGTADDVRRNVRETMVKASPRGGFILGPSHSIAKGVKYDNFMALLDEFAQWRERF
jgi:uroporphyrinogen decarboxylase